MTTKTVIFSIFLLATLVVGQSQKEASNRQESSHEGDHQPAPEPYSFSYSSESVGGQSTHQESGDGSGRVSGFYTIMGEDGRERRVDYVADENGYRASVSTNEVGTRSENSADAQYNARLPSDKQLEQAKVTAQQYQYLEETHAAERERHLARLNSKEQNQQHNSQWSTNNAQSQQQRFPPNQLGAWNSPRQQGSSSFGQQQFNQQSRFGSNQAGQFSQGPSYQQSSTGSQQGGSSSSSSSSFSASTEGVNSGNYGQTGPTSQSDDLDWRQRSNFTGNFQQNAGQGATWLQRINTDSSQSGNRLQQAAPSTESTLISQPDVTQNTPLAQQVSAQSTIGTQQPQSQRLDGVQQFQQAAWMMANRGGVPTRKPATVLQKQLEAQFMQQAQQLTDQDYPRQQGYLANQQYQDRYSQRFNNAGQQGQQFINGQQVVATNNQRPGELNQINQQQTNIIDEIGDQVDGQAGGDQQVNVIGGGGVGGIISQNIQQQPQRKDNSYDGQLLVTPTNRPNLVATFTQQQQQQQEPIQTTFNQTVPSGFVSIPLVEQNNNIIRPSAGQFQEQEVDQRPYSTIAPGQSTTQFGYNQFVNQSTTSGQPQDVQTQTADFQQVTVGAGNQQQQQLEEISSRPDSIKQIIEQQKQQGTKQQEQQFTRPTGSFFSRPATTPAALVYQTTPGPVVVETTRAPVYVLETTTPRQVVYIQPSTTTTTTQTPVVVVENQTVDYRPVVSTTVDTNVPTSSLATRRPQQQQQQQLQQQQQVITSNIKGGSQYARQQNTRFNPRPANNTTFVDNNTNLLNRETFSSMRPGNFSATFTTANQRPSTNYYENQRTTFPTEPSREIPRVPVQVEVQADLQRQPVVSSPYALQQQQQTGYQPRQPLSNLQTNFTRPARVEYQQQQQQQPLKGTKGGSSSSKTNKRQFWLNQQQLSAGRNLTTTGNFQSNVGVDYANTDFGSRVASRLR